MGDRHDITIEQGALFTLEVEWPGVDLSAYTAAMQVRAKHTSPTAALTLTSEDGDITLTDDGFVRVEAVASATREVKAGAYVYDLEIYPDGDEEQTIRLVEGRARVTPEATR